MAAKGLVARTPGFGVRGFSVGQSISRGPQTRVLS